LIATDQDALGYAANSVLVEVDWDKDSKPVDAADRALFKKRAAGLFDGKIKSKNLATRFD